MRERVIDIDENDRRVWEIITDVPALKAPWQYVCFVLNVVFPGKRVFDSNTVGLGTMISSCFCAKWSKTLFMVGVFQLFLAYILIGWILSIYWGYLIVKKSLQDQHELQNFLDKNNLKSDQQEPPYAEGNGLRR